MNDESIARRQIILDKKPIRQSKNFLSSMYAYAGFVGTQVFNVYEGGLQAKRDETMSLETFLDLKWERPNVRLQVGDPQKDVIILCVALNVIENDWRSRKLGERVTKSTWVTLPLTTAHYQECMAKYEQAYGGKA